jgi:diguanylate cyclase (GGDEF)-like protein/PAS domain S-box-containing protein
MNSKSNNRNVAPRILLTVISFFVLAIVFSIYVITEKKIDRANEQRLNSFQLTDQLLQSSDDLTRMARAFVVTSDPRYKIYYQNILDIRDGKMARPYGYFYGYWDMVLANAQLPPSEAGQTVSLLDMIRRSGFTDEELGKLTEAKLNSDRMAALGFAAMKLVDSPRLETAVNRERATLMLHSDEYYEGKAKIMRPINEVHNLMERRTLDAVHDAENIALTFRLIFIVTTLGTIFMLWRTYTSLRTALGGTADEIHKNLVRIGSGDFSTDISVKPGMENSVLAGLSEMQIKLYVHEIERQHAEAELRIAAVAFESQESLMITNADNKILRVNRAFCESSGYTAEDLIGNNPCILSSDRHNADFYCTMWKTIKDTGTWQGEIWDRRKDGEIYPKLLTISTVKNSRGMVTHHVGSHIDITERKLAEDKITELAFFDPLTHLPNRTLLLDHLKRAVVSGKRNGTFGAVLFIDLDQFKTLNDTSGHGKGDLLLQQVAQRIFTSVREGDTVARMGGDEFVVVLEGLTGSIEEAATQTEIIGRKILTAISQSYQLGGIHHRSTASMGATLIQCAETSIDELLKQADLAMYKSKAMGRNGLRFFDPAMQTIVVERAAMELDLHTAIQDNQFVLHYQAQVASDGRATGAEALVRWQHPHRGMLPPNEFILLAEETGLILPLGQWVLETACAQLALWAIRPEMAHLTVSVNVSAQQFREVDFVDKVMAAIIQTGSNPSRLKLELTESLLVDNVGDIIDKMTVLKARGIDFSLDDFGTGYSSLSYLRRLPLNQLKIDKLFVRDVLTDRNDAAIARAIVTLAQSLGMGVIAEGVETELQRDFLASIGCHAYQGYFFSRPLPVQGFEEFALRA